MEEVDNEKTKKIQEDLDQLIKEKASEILYLATYETCIKFKLFNKPKRMYLVLFTALKTFLTKHLSDIEDDKRRKEEILIIEKFLDKLHSEFKT